MMPMWLQNTDLVTVERLGLACIQATQCIRWKDNSSGGPTVNKKSNTHSGRCCSMIFGTRWICAFRRTLFEEGMQSHGGRRVPGW
jgi:hypothetical protein